MCPVVRHRDQILLYLSFILFLYSAIFLTKNIKENIPPNKHPIKNPINKSVRQFISYIFNVCKVSVFFTLIRNIYKFC